MDIVESINRFLSGNKLDKGTRTRMTRARDEIVRLRGLLGRDTSRIDWLASADNKIGHVLLPIECVEANLCSLRDAIDMAMGMEGLVNELPKTHN